MTHFKLSKACSKYGAEMGRGDERGDPDYAYKFRLQRLKFVDGCYDQGGAYWGAPENVWRAEGEIKDGDVVADAIKHLRAGSREEAKAKILILYPKARFYR